MRVPFNGGVDRRPASVVFYVGHGFSAVVAAVGEYFAHAANGRANTVQRGLQLFFVVGCVAHLPADDEHGFDLDGGLRVVALLEASAVFHDTAFGVREVILVFGPGAFLWGFGPFPSGLFPAGFLFGFAFS